MQNKRIKELRDEAEKVYRVLESAPAIDKTLEVPLEEYQRRQRELARLIKETGFDVGIVFSDEH